MIYASILLYRFRHQTHVTPKSYLSFVDGYKTIYAEKRSQIGELANRMNTGLDKLVEASASVAELSKELVVKEKELAVASVKADKVMLITSNCLDCKFYPPIMNSFKCAHAIQMKLEFGRVGLWLEGETGEPGENLS